MAADRLRYERGGSRNHRDHRRDHRRDGPPECKLMTIGKKGYLQKEKQHVTALLLVAHV
jgi:hypothetical protein